MSDKKVTEISLNDSVNPSANRSVVGQNIAEDGKLLPAYANIFNFNWKQALQILGILAAISLIAAAILTVFSIVPAIPVIGIAATACVYGFSAIVTGGISLKSLFTENQKNSQKNIPGILPMNDSRDSNEQNNSRVQNNNSIVDLP